MGKWTDKARARAEKMFSLNDSAKKPEKDCENFGGIVAYAFRSDTGEPLGSMKLDLSGPATKSGITSGGAGAEHFFGLKAGSYTLKPALAKNHAAFLAEPQQQQVTVKENETTYAPFEIDPFGSIHVKVVTGDTKKAVEGILVRLSDREKTTEARSGMAKFEYLAPKQHTITIKLSGPLLDDYDEPAPKTVTAKNNQSELVQIELKPAEHKITLMEVTAETPRPILRAPQARKQYINLEADPSEPRPHPEYGRVIRFKAKIEKMEKGQARPLSGRPIYFYCKGDPANRKDLLKPIRAGFEGQGDDPERKEFKTEKDGWTPVVRFNCSQYGGDKFEVYATKSSAFTGGEKAGAYTVWRRLYYEIDCMKRSPSGTYADRSEEAGMKTRMDKLFIELESVPKDNPPDNLRIITETEFTQWSEKWRSEDGKKRYNQRRYFHLALVDTLGVDAKDLKEEFELAPGKLKATIKYPASAYDLDPRKWCVGVYFKQARKFDEAKTPVGKKIRNIVQNGLDAEHAETIALAWDLLKIAVMASGVQLAMGTESLSAPPALAADILSAESKRRAAAGTLIKSLLKMETNAGTKSAVLAGFGAALTNALDQNAGTTSAQDLVEDLKKLAQQVLAMEGMKFWMWTRLGDQYIKLEEKGTAAAKDDRYEASIDLSAVGLSTVLSTTLKVIIRAWTGLSGVQAGPATLVAMRWRERAFKAADLKSSTLNTMMHEPCHFLGLAATLLPDGAYAKDTYFKNGHHCKKNKNTCLMWETNSKYTDLCTDCADAARGRNLTRLPVSGNAPYA